MSYPLQYCPPEPNFTIDKLALTCISIKTMKKINRINLWRIINTWFFAVRVSNPLFPTIDHITKWRSGVDHQVEEYEGKYSERMVDCCHKKVIKPSYLIFFIENLSLFPRNNLNAWKHAQISFLLKFLFREINNSIYLEICYFSLLIAKSRSNHEWAKIGWSISYHPTSVFHFFKKFSCLDSMHYFVEQYDIRW